MINVTNVNGDGVLIKTCYQYWWGWNPYSCMLPMWISGIFIANFDVVESFLIRETI